MSPSRSSAEQWDEIEFLSAPVLTKDGSQLFQVARRRPSGLAKDIGVYLTKPDASRIDRFCKSRGEAFRPVRGMGASVLLEAGTDPFGNAAFALKKVRVPLRETGFLSAWRRDQAAMARARLESLRDEPRAFAEMSDAERNELSEALQTRTLLVIAPRSSAGEQDLVHELTSAEVAPNRFRVEHVTMQTDPARVAAGIARAMRDTPGRDALVVVTRGGTGVALAPFDSFEVAQVLHSSPVPALCAVGHQRDVHLSDKAAAWSAITPSDAGLSIARLMCPRQDEPESARSGTSSAQPHRPQHEGARVDSDDTRPLPHGDTPAGWGPNGPAPASATSAMGWANAPAPFTAPSDPLAPVPSPPSEPTVAQLWRRRQRRRRVIRAVLVIGVLGLLIWFFWSILGTSLHGMGDEDTHARAQSAQSFVSPSGNIVCEVSATDARCDIDRVNYGVPAVPPKCAETPNWGHVFVIGDAGAHYSCPGTRRTQTTFPAKTLAYGDTVTVGVVTCRSMSTGVTCERDGHGFTLAKDSKRLW